MPDRKPVQKPARKPARKPVGDPARSPARTSALVAPPVLHVEHLSISFSHPRPAVEDVSVVVRAGEVLALVGESGSGKSMTARAVLGLLPPGARATGSIRYDGRDLLTLDERALDKVRGARIAMVFQEPQTALNPVRTIGWQLREALRAHAKVSRSWARERAIHLLEQVEIPDPEERLDYYPHQLSGGQKQRVVLALALANRPEVLLADEPTTALDVTVQAEILRLLGRIRERTGIAIVLITHNMGVVAEIADRVVVLQAGNVVETGETRALFADPQEPYTKALLGSVLRLPRRVGVGALDAPRRPGEVAGPAATSAAATAAAPEPGGAGEGPGEHPGDARGPEPRGNGTTDVAVRGARLLDRRAPLRRSRVPEPSPDAEPALISPAVEFRGVHVRYGSRRRGRWFPAVDDVSLTVGRGEVVGLVGESGSGKTTLGRLAAGLVPLAGGEVLIDGRSLLAASLSERRDLRRGLAFVHQDPEASLDPRFSIRESVREPLDIHGVGTGTERDARVAELLEAVHLPASYADRRPRELSGGQRQRIALARALALDPTLLVADEPTSALDVSVQARVLELFGELQDRLGFACLFISHDLAVVHAVAHRVAVLRAGRLVETGPVGDVFTDPQEAYTRRLLEAVPVPDPARSRGRRVRELAS